MAQSVVSRQRSKWSFWGKSGHQPLESKLNDAPTGCVSDGIGTSDCIKLVDQSTYMEFGRMDRYAQTASYRLVGHALGKKSQYLELAWG